MELAVATVVITMIAMLAAYYVIHWMAPTWGTVLTNVIAGAAMLIDYLQFLPWGTVLSAQQAALVAFAIAAANGLIRLRGPKAAVGSGP